MIRTVLHLSDSNVFGGTERGILHLIAGLDRSCWRPVLLHHPDAPDALVTGATHAGAETAVAEHVRGKYDVGGIARLSFRMRQYDPAIVHAHLHWPLACKYGIAAAGLARVPVTVATAQLHLDLEAAGFVDLQHRLMTRRVDRYIAVSRHVAAGLERRFRVPPEKVTVIPNAVDLESLRNGAPLPPMGWPSGNGRWVALVLARLEAEKGVDVAIEAAARVPEIDLVIAGEGSLRATLEAHAATLGIPGRVFFLGHRSDTPALLRHADVLVLPSLREGLPLSVLEAMAANVAVVATDIGGTREAIVHEESGLLVPVGDAGALADAIRRTLSDQQGTAMRVAAARGRVEREFSTRTVVRRVTALYDSLLSAKAR